MKNIKWTLFAPWFLTISCVIVLIVIGYFLTSNIDWFKEGVFNEKILDVNKPEYRFEAYHLHMSIIKRSVGLFSGFAIMLLGLAVAFFTLKDTTDINAEGAMFKAKIVTASPGLIALLIGAYLIVSVIKSKDTFLPYQSNSYDIEIFDKTEKPIVPKNKNK